MIVNKSMYPLKTGFGVIAKMQDQFATLQMQMGTGEKASTLAGMGRDLPLSLSVRSRLSKIEGFSANIDTVNLRLSFLDKVMTRFDKIEGEARNSAMQGQYGTNNVNMATLPSLSHARLDELVTLLNSDVAGRYLFGGDKTDTAPLPTTDVLLEGQAGKAGFKTVLNERMAADAGQDGRGRLQSTLVVGASEVPGPATPSVVSLAEDGVHPFGIKLSNVSTTVSNSALSYTAPAVSVPPTAKSLSVTFAPTPAEQIQAGNTVTLGLTLPDGTETQITLRATTAAEATGSVGEFIIGADSGATATNFQTALNAKLDEVGKTELVGASTFAASQNFFNGAGEPVVRVSGTPASSAIALRVATSADTVMWYGGQSPAVAAENLGRTTVAASGNTATFSQQVPVSSAHGFTISNITASSGSIITTPPSGANKAVTVQFAAVPDPLAPPPILPDPPTMLPTLPGEKVEVTLTEPPPKSVSRTVSLTAVSSRPGPGQFLIGADPEETAKNFASALNGAVSEAAKAAEGNPRQSVTALVDDVTRVSYGMEANESGFLRMMRTMAAMSVVSYPAGDATDMGRFDAMAKRQQLEMSEGHNAERGSIEILAMEIGVAHGTLQNSTERHTNYKAQLENLLSDVETVNKEDVAMELLALQTRLQASYQATSMISKLSLVNYM